MDHSPKLLYPALVVAALSVTLFSLLGIATLTGHFPLASAAVGVRGDLPDGVPPIASSPSPSTPAATTLTEAGPIALPSRPAARAAAAARPACANCGAVESIVAVERKGEASGLGAIAGGVTGALLGNQMGKGHGRTGMTVLAGAGGAYVGNRIEQDLRRSSAWRIAVRMDDGRLRTLYQREAPNVAIGRQVEIVGNSIVPLG